MSEKGEAAFSRTQPYDTSFKAFLDKVPLALLSFLLGEEILFAQELKETLFKQESIKPPLRVDCAYLVHTRERQADGPFVLHLEEETAPNEEVEGRLAEYAIMLFRKHHLAIVQLLLCPFETKQLPRPPSKSSGAKRYARCIIMRWWPCGSVRPVNSWSASKCACMRCCRR